MFNVIPASVRMHCIPAEILMGETFIVMRGKSLFLLRKFNPKGSKNFVAFLSEVRR